MSIYVRSRGLTFDYRFLDDAPDEAWWRAYGEHSRPESPTVLVESDGEQLDKVCVFAPVCSLSAASLSAPDVLVSTCDLHMDTYGSRSVTVPFGLFTPPARWIMGPVF